MTTDPNFITTLRSSLGYSVGDLVWLHVMNKGGKLILQQDKIEEINIKVTTKKTSILFSLENTQCEVYPDQLHKTWQEACMSIETKIYTPEDKTNE